MAKLSAHGIEVGRIEYIAKTVAYFADGKVLKNDGFGWEKHATVKAGVAPQDAFAYVKERQDKFIADNPSFAAYRKLMLETPLSIRWKVISAMELMDTDIDGVWSTLDDSYDTRGRFSLEDVQEMCAARGAAILEKTTSRVFCPEKSDQAAPVSIEA